MGLIKTIKGDDGKPYISLEDLILEIESLKKYSKENNINRNSNFVDIVLMTLHNMEERYYEDFLFRKNNKL